MARQWTRLCLTVGALGWASTGCTGVEVGDASLRVVELDEAFSGFGLLYEPDDDPQSTLIVGDSALALYAELRSEAPRAMEVMVEASLPLSGTTPSVRYWEREGGPWREAEVLGGRIALDSDGSLSFAFDAELAGKGRTIEQGSLRLPAPVPSPTPTREGTPDAAGCGGGVAAGRQVWVWTREANPGRPPAPIPSPRPVPAPIPASAPHPGPIWERPSPGTYGNYGDEASPSGCGADEGSDASEDWGAQDTEGCAGDPYESSSDGCGGDATDGTDGCSDSGCEGDMAAAPAPWFALQRFSARFGPCLLAAGFNRWQRRRRRGLPPPASPATAPGGGPGG